MGLRTPPTGTAGYGSFDVNTVDAVEQRGGTTEDVRQQTYVAGVRLLANREHSRTELRRKLRVRGYSPDVIEAALTRLAKDGYQSDVRFAETFVRSRLERGQGLLKIAAALRQRGVDDEVASAPLDLGDAEWRRLAAAALRKRFGDDAPASRTDWSRRARFLAGRGFSSDIAARVLDIDGS